jgi:thiamine transport system permease protein
VLILGGAAYLTLETESYLRMVNLLNLSGAAAVARPVRRGGGRPRRQRGGTQAPGNRTAPALRFGNRPHAGTRRAVGVAVGCAVLGLLLVPIIALVVKSVSTSDG